MLTFQEFQKSVTTQHSGDFVEISFNRTLRMTTNGELSHREQEHYVERLSRMLYELVARDFGGISEPIVDTKVNPLAGTPTFENGSAQSARINISDLSSRLKEGVSTFDGEGQMPKTDE